MTGLPWFKFWQEFAEDMKIQQLPHEYQRHFVMIMCRRCKFDADQKDTDGLIEVYLRETKKKTKECKEMLLSLGLIDEFWNPTNWDKRQNTSTKATRDCRAKKVGW